MQKDPASDSPQAVPTKKKSEISPLVLPCAKLGFADTPSASSTRTPNTRQVENLLRNCDEVGLFEDLKNVNPFEETFRKAVGQQTASDSTPAKSSEELHTPQLFPALRTPTATPAKSKLAIEPPKTATGKQDEEQRSKTVKLPITIPPPPKFVKILPKMPAPEVYPVVHVINQRSAKDQLRMLLLKDTMRKKEKDQIKTSKPSTPAKVSIKESPGNSNAKSTQKEIKSDKRRKLEELERIKMAARRYRKRKKVQEDSLKEENLKLREENERLRAELETLKNVFGSLIDAKQNVVPVIVSATNVSAPVMLAKESNVERK